MGATKVIVGLVLFILFSCFVSAVYSFDFEPIAVKRYQKVSRGFDTKELPVLDFVGLVKRHGYPAEEHKVTTPDGYRLRFHRIPGSPSKPKARGKPVVYIQHGILASSDMFVVAGPNKDLAFILADAGYDVWLGNGRGNTYSRSHVRLPSDSPEFWRFSFHEIAVYDVSSMINYILRKTNQRTVVYVAHSMGTTIGMVLLSTLPEFNEKISVVINMATIGNWKNPRNFMKLLRAFGLYIQVTLAAARIVEVFPQTLGGGQILNGTCRDGSLFQRFCTAAIQFVSGYDPDQLDTDLLVNGLAYFPAGGSTQTLTHFYQNMISGRLQMYDHGLVKNLFSYGRIVPPLYNLTNINVPLVLIYGKGDTVATTEDSLDLIRNLRNAKAESVPHRNFTHLDFIWAKDIKHLLHDRVLEIIQRSQLTTRIENL
ncbi:hypothetical protein QAD02_008862 [Eretmocerus hayati]|uniref:Uncharacterized protein n=1 Tax=Eretmocerus hayati TaxID=131215 RepID=A0ACC2NC26_9HYME|nr:hypothetical protein QAD02_008862 [Eretmocerus hayati]